MAVKLITIYLTFVTVSALAQTDIKTKNYQVEPFNKIETQGGGSLNIKYADKHTLKVSTTKDCLDLVKVSVLSETLYIDIKKLETNNCHCKIEIGVPVVNKLVQHGGGSIVISKGFSRVNSFECKVEGGGNIDLAELAVDDFRATIEGGGKILLTAQKKLEGNISGGGLIEYLGAPNVISNVSGGGTIRKQKL